MIKAILFDMDGVLADTEDVSITIGKMYFETLGKRAERKHFDPHLGCGEEEFFVGTAKELGLKDFSYSEASLFFKEHYPEMLAKVAVALPGGKRLIDMAYRAGLKVAIASSAPKWKVYENIRAVGIDEEKLSLVVTGGDIVRNKPFGDIYNLCLIKLGLSPDEAIVFEDTAGGIKAGKAAGCRAISLTTTIDSETAFNSGADGVISDLSCFSEFDTIEEFENELDVFCGFSPDSVVYGANYIAPLKKKMPYELVKKNAIDLAWKAWANAYAPYSKFKVGASVVSASTGRIYNGCNVENSSYGATICAERNAILSAVAAEGKIGIDLIVIVSDDDPPAPPCAMCRQVMSEFSSPDTKIVLASKNGVELEYSFKDLLPYPFIMPSMRK